MSAKKLVLVFVGLFLFIFVGGIVLAYMKDQPIEMEKSFAESFYYAAIGFAVYHIFTRNKQVREDRAKRDAETEANDVESRDADADYDGQVVAHDEEGATGENKDTGLS